MLISPSSLDPNPDRPLGFHADSPLGLYVRRCRLYVSCLEFDQVSGLMRRLKSFCSTRAIRSTSVIHHRASTSGSSHTEPPAASKAFGFESTTPPLALFKQPSEIASSGYSTLHRNIHHEKEEDDSTADPILQAYLEFTDSYAPDFHKASNALRKFYDSRSRLITDLKERRHAKSSRSPGSNHQEALLALANLHFSLEAYPTAMDALEEATRLARLAGDRAIIDQCTCVRRRLMFFSGLEDEEAERDHLHRTMPLVGPIQAQASLQSLRNLGHSDQKASKSKYRSMNSTAGSNVTNEWLYWDSSEEVFSVFKSLSRAEPLNHLHARLFRASRMRINNLEDVGEPRTTVRSSFDKVSWFALQARLWDLQGQAGLCEIYEDLALDVDESELNMPNSLHLISKSDVICQRALRWAKNGNFYHAMLLIYDLIDENRCDLKSFRFIQRTVLRIFELKAKYAGDPNTALSLKMTPNPTVIDFYPLPVPSFNSTNTSVHSYIEHLYEQAENSIGHANYHAALCPIVSGISHSEKMNLLVEQSKGIILWSQVMLNMQPPPPRESSNDAMRDDGAESDQPRMVDWVVEQKLKAQRVVDLPGLISNSCLSAELMVVMIRAKILNFSSFIKKTDPSSTWMLNLRERVFELADLCWMGDKFYQKTENLKGRKRLLGYQLLIISEALDRISSLSSSIRLGTAGNTISTEEVEETKSSLMELERRLKRSWMNDFSQLREADAQAELLDLLDLFKSLLTRASVRRYL